MHRGFPAALLALVVAVAATTVAAPAGKTVSIPWAVDPEDPGPDLPPDGRSAFDDLTGGGRSVPFPFAALVRAVEERLGGGPAAAGAIQRVLVPLGRSLQRSAAAPRFFHAPRAVAAVVGDPGRPGAPLLKDRLYLAFQETAAVVEVVSYNEAAGRFEFQVVRDYREGGRPRVLYASRALCTACHQNAAPIFARQLWDETNANRRVAGLLRAEGRDFYGFPVDPGPDAPYDVQAAADRANRFALDQRLWMEGCGADGDGRRCRAALLTAALQYRLTGGRFDAAPLAPDSPAVVRLRERFPAGLAVPDPDLPNRDPFAGDAASGSAAVHQASTPAALDPERSALLGGVVLHSSIPAPFEPLNPRPPLETWTADDGLERLVSGLAAFLSEADVRELDARLAAAGSAPGAPRRVRSGDCRLAARRDASGALDRLKLDCRGAVALQGRIHLSGGYVTGGEVERIAVDGAEELADLAVQGSSAAALTLVQKGSGLRARRPGGDAVERLELSWTDTGGGVLEGRAALVLLADFAAAGRAIEEMRGDDSLSGRPFRRTVLVPALLARLGAPAPASPDQADLPPPELDVLGGRGTEAAEAERLGARFPEPALRAFFRYCATCHATDQPSPPNFLHGEPAEVRARLADCAERIYFRLAVWQLAHDDRPKTGMPPLHALRRLAIDPADWPAHPDLLLLRQHAADLVRARTGAPPRLDEMAVRGYENLRRCPSR